VQRKISAACYVFLGKTGTTITGTVTGPRCYSHDLPQGGMEIPWVMKFAGDKIMVNKVKSLLIDTRRPIPSSAREGLYLLLHEKAYTFFCTCTS